MVDAGFDSLALDPDLKPEDGDRPSGYRAVVLPEAEVTKLGIRYQRGAEGHLLSWTRVARAFAAEIGEPEGVRTVVFDLALGLLDADCVACRFDAEPGEDAVRVAQAIEVGAGRERCSPSLLSLAAEGLPSGRYVDLESFEETILHSLRTG